MSTTSHGLFRLTLQSITLRFGPEAAQRYHSRRRAILAKKRARHERNKMTRAALYSRNGTAPSTVSAKEWHDTLNALSKGTANT